MQNVCRLEEPFVHFVFKQFFFSERNNYNRLFAASLLRNYFHFEFEAAKNE